MRFLCRHAVIAEVAPGSREVETGAKKSWVDPYSLTEQTLGLRQIVGIQARNAFRKNHLGLRSAGGCCLPLIRLLPIRRGLYMQYTRNPKQRQASEYPESRLWPEALQPNRMAALVYPFNTPRHDLCHYPAKYDSGSPLKGKPTRNKAVGIVDCI